MPDVQALVTADAGTITYTTDGKTLACTNEQKAATAAGERAYEAGQYIGNRNSHIFHRPTCRTLPAEKNRVYFTSRDEAGELGVPTMQELRPLIHREKEIWHMEYLGSLFGGLVLYAIIHFIVRAGGMSLGAKFRAMGNLTACRKLRSSRKSARRTPKVPCLTEARCCNGCRRDTISPFFLTPMISLLASRMRPRHESLC